METGETTPNGEAVRELVIELSVIHGRSVPLAKFAEILGLPPDEMRARAMDEEWLKAIADRRRDRETVLRMVKAMCEGLTEPPRAGQPAVITALVVKAAEAFVEWINLATPDNPPEADAGRAEASEVGAPTAGTRRAAACPASDGACGA